MGENHPSSLGLNLSFMNNGFGDQVFSSSLLKGVTLTFERLVTGSHVPF
jgi:hypothetical protein